MVDKLLNGFVGLWVGAGLVFIVIAIAYSVQSCQAENNCREAGGTVERYNFRTIWAMQSCGSGCTYMQPIQTSDWRCVGLKAERE